MTINSIFRVVYRHRLEAAAGRRIQDDNVAVSVLSEGFPSTLPNSTLAASGDSAGAGAGAASISSGTRHAAVAAGDDSGSAQSGGGGIFACPIYATEARADDQRGRGNRSAFIGFASLQSDLGEQEATKLAPALVIRENC